MTRTRPIRSSSRGFTLAELVVAIGAALLLTFGVGQVFQSVGNIVSQGTAIAEVDQLARAIERQIRDDFDAMNSMRAEDTFLAIRNRIVTDVYLSREDMEADRREGTVGTSFSRIIPETRLDEIMFIAQSTEDAFVSYEKDPNNLLTTSSGTVFVPGVVSSRYARIYYGHGLRPVPEPRDLEPNTPFVRVADGDFGAPRDDANRDNIFGVGNGISYMTIDGLGGAVNTDQISDDERNRYAGDWPLARQALLLHDEGGTIMGRPTTGGPSGPSSIIGSQREYAPYIRDLQTENRFDITERDPDPGPSDIALIAPTSIDPDTVPNPRLIRHGRTDICAQSLEEVRRWLEGLQAALPLPPAGASFVGIPYVDATAWSGGAWDVFPTNPVGAVTDSNASNERDAPLWQRFFVNSPNGLNIMLQNNLREIQTAIAGCFTRILVETDPPDVDRVLDVSSMPTSSTAPEDALMDLHAMLAPRCSRFEIAWSDGSRWDNSVTPVTNSTFTNNFFRPEDENINPGDRIWFDYNFTRRDLWLIETRYSLRIPGRAFQDPEILPGEAPSSAAANAPIFRTSWTGLPGLAGERETRLNLDANAMGGALSNTYDPLRTGGATGEDEFADNDDEEYLAVFPFRLLAESGDDTAGYVFDRPFPKPTHIRIRMTLHDSQLVLREGKTFEFVVRVDPR